MNPHYEAIKRIVELHTEESDLRGWAYDFNITMFGKHIIFHGQYPEKDKSVKEIMGKFTKYINELPNENN